MSASTTIANTTGRQPEELGGGVQVIEYASPLLVSCVADAILPALAEAGEIKVLTTEHGRRVSLPEESR